MGLGVGILLIAAGAILGFAVNVDTSGTGVNLHTIGLILPRRRCPGQGPKTEKTSEHCNDL